MRVFVAVVAVACLVGAFFCAPTTHQHSAYGPESQTVFHAHSDAHSGDTSGQTSADADHNEGARYVALFQARTSSPFSLVFEPSTEPRLPLLAPVVLLSPSDFAADAHSPPLLDQLPARSPPSIDTSALY